MKLKHYLLEAKKTTFVGLIDSIISRQRNPRDEYDEFYMYSGWATKKQVKFLYSLYKQETGEWPRGDQGTPSVDGRSVGRSAPNGTAIVKRIEMKKKYKRT